MQMKNLFVFLMAVALALPLATAFNCTALHGEDKKILQESQVMIEQISEMQHCIFQKEIF